MIKFKTILSILALLLLGTNIYAQVKPVAASSDSSFKIFKTINGVFNTVNVDILGNIYLLTETNRLKKLNSNGDSLSNYNDVKKFGTVSYIDAINPLKVLLYYKNYSTVVILDRQLALRSSINFRKQNIFKVKTIATSYDNNIWIFDEQDFKLKKIDDNGITLSETTDMRQVFEKAPTPTKIIDNENSIYLYDKLMGLFVFDYYGSLKQQIPIKGWTNIAVVNNIIMGITTDTLNNLNLKTLVTKTYKLPAFFNGYKDIIALNGKIYLLKKASLEIYTIQ